MSELLDLINTYDELGNHINDRLIGLGGEGYCSWRDVGLMWAWNEGFELDEQLIRTAIAKMLRGLSDTVITQKDTIARLKAQLAEK